MVREHRKSSTFSPNADPADEDRAGDVDTRDFQAAEVAGHLDRAADVAFDVNRVQSPVDVHLVGVGPAHGDGVRSARLASDGQLAQLIEGQVSVENIDCDVVQDAVADLARTHAVRMNVRVFGQIARELETPPAVSDRNRYGPFYTGKNTTHVSSPGPCVPCRYDGLSERPCGNCLFASGGVFYLFSR